MDVLTIRHCDVSADMDMVRLSVGNASAMFPYQTAFEIAQSVRVASKMCMQHDHIPHKEHHDIALCADFVEGGKVHPHFRRSNLSSSIGCWRVGGEGVLVVIELDDTIIKLDYPDALKLHKWIRAGAKQAKAWAGDRSKGMRGLATLTDAEDNYRLGVT